MLRRAVLARLIVDPSVAAGHIAVAADSGHVTLSGYVTSAAQKDAARAAAGRVKGVDDVADDVRLAVPCPDWARLSPDAAWLSLIVVVDPAGADVYGIDRSVDGGHALTDDDASRLLHHLRRDRRAADSDAAEPENEPFFEQVADAVSAGEAIVVIGQGQGRSAEADRLGAYLRSHHEQTWARSVRELGADLSCLTTPEQLELGCQAFAGPWTAPPGPT